MSDLRDGARLLYPRLGGRNERSSDMTARTCAPELIDEDGMVRLLTVSKVPIE